jgi:xylulokinase
MNATGVAEEVCRAFGSDHASLGDEAARVPAGSRGLLWLPYLQGERVPDLPCATGTLAGLRPGSLDRAVVYRAALEGVALNLEWGLERMRAAGVAIESARIVGGAAKNALWCRILADVLAIPLVRLEEPESAALGAALQAAWNVRRSRGESVDADALAREFVIVSGSTFVPRADDRDAYRDASRRFRDLARRVHAIE